MTNVTGRKIYIVVSLYQYTNIVIKMLYRPEKRCVYLEVCFRDKTKRFPIGQIILPHHAPRKSVLRTLGTMELSVYNAPKRKKVRVEK